MLLYEMFCLCKYRRSSFKDGIKVGFKIVDLVAWTKYAGVLLSFVDRKCFWFCFYYEVFLKYLCEHPRVRLTVWKLMCWICLHPRVRLIFYVMFSLVLINPFKIDFEKVVNFFSDPSEIFKLLGMICCLRRRWWCKLIRMAAEKGSFERTGKHVLDIEFWSHSDATMKDLWQRFSWRFNGWSRSWFKIMLWSWGPFVCQETNLVICVMKLIGLQVLDLLARNKIWYS